MVGSHLGLVEVPTPDLERALRHLVRGEMDFPLTVVSLTRIGLQHRAPELLHALRDLDAQGVRAVLVAVLAERKWVREGRPIGVPTS